MSNRYILNPDGSIQKYVENDLFNRWNEIRVNELNIDNLLFRIDYYYYYLNDRANMNDRRWGIYDGFETYDGIVEEFKTWIRIFTARARKKKSNEEGLFETYLEFLSQTNSKGLI